MADVFLFMAALLTIIVTLVVINVVCGHSKLKTVGSKALSLQHLKGVEVTDPRFQDVYCTCKTQWYTIALLILILLGIVFIVTNMKSENPTCLGDICSQI